MPLDAKPGTSGNLIGGGSLIFLEKLLECLLKSLLLLKLGRGGYPGFQSWQHAAAHYSPQQSPWQPSQSPPGGCTGSPSFQ